MTIAEQVRNNWNRFDDPIRWAPGGQIQIEWQNNPVLAPAPAPEPVRPCRQAKRRAAREAAKSARKGSTPK